MLHAANPSRPATSIAALLPAPDQWRARLAAAWSDKDAALASISATCSGLHLSLATWMAIVCASLASASILTALVSAACAVVVMSIGVAGVFLAAVGSTASVLVSFGGLTSGAFAAVLAAAAVAVGTAAVITGAIQWAALYVRSYLGLPPLPSPPSADPSPRTGTGSPSCSSARLSAAASDADPSTPAATAAPSSAEPAAVKTPNTSQHVPSAAAPRGAARPTPLSSGASWPADAGPPQQDP